MGRRKSQVYHYCSLETFNAIISNKTIRICDLNKTNDFMEKQWIVNYIGEAIEETFQELNLNINLKTECTYAKNLNDVLKRSIEGYILRGLPVLIACFSHEKDRLSQWRAYGDDGFGVSIGFNLRLLEKLRNDDMNLMCSDVFYKKDKQMEVIKEGVMLIVNYMKDAFERGINPTGTDNFEYFLIDGFDEFCDELCIALNNLANFIKNPAFIEEDEFRITYDPDYPREVTSWSEIDELFKNKKTVKNYEISPIKYYVKNNQLVSYCEINFEKYIKDNIIEEIVIGPKSKVTEEDVYYYLFATGYDPDNILISKSEATYR